MASDQPLLVTTVDNPPGVVILDVLGLAVGTEARPLNRYADGAKPLTPGDTQTYPRILRAARFDAVNLMREHARALGANAVFGVRFDTRTLGETWIELCAYGTAVLLADSTAAVMPTRPSPYPRPRPAGYDNQPAGRLGGTRTNGPTG